MSVLESTISRTNTVFVSDCFVFVAEMVTVFRGVGS